MSIGERIATLRKERNISQNQLAKTMNVTRQAVSKWENDQTAPDTLKLIQLADVLDTDVEYLATGNHAKREVNPQVVPVYRDRFVEVEKIVEKPVIVERIIEKPVLTEKIIEVENPIVPGPRMKRVERIRFLRNPIEYIIVSLLSFLIGLLLGCFLC